MRKSLTTAAVLTIAALAAATATPAGAASVYTDQSDFLTNALAPGYASDNFNDLTYGGVTGSSFSRGVINGFQVTFTGGTGGLYSSPGSMSVNNAGDLLTLTFDSGNVYAVGGTFFAGDISGNITTGHVTVTLADSTTVDFTGGPTFYGFVSPSAPITSLSITTGGSYNNNFVWPGVDDLYYGATLVSGNDNGGGQPSAVPTPAAAFGALPLLASLAYRRFRRNQAL